jgi:predicted secreted acid phosphatase
MGWPLQAAPPCLKGLQLVKKHSLILVAILSIAASSSTAGAQQSAAKPSAPARQQPAFSANAAAERIPNLDALKQQLKQYHDCTCKCGCYARDIDGQADRAIAFLRRRVAHREAQQKTASTQKLAMVFDIDETSLSNYPEFLKADFAYDSKAFDAWAQTAQAPAIRKPNGSASASSLSPAGLNPNGRPLSAISACKDFRSGSS